MLIVAALTAAMRHRHPAAGAGQLRRMASSTERATFCGFVRRMAGRALRVFAANLRDLLVAIATIQLWTRRGTVGLVAL